MVTGELQCLVLVRADSTFEPLPRAVSAPELRQIFAIRAATDEGGWGMTTPTTEVVGGQTIAGLVKVVACEKLFINR